MLGSFSFWAMAWWEGVRDGGPTTRRFRKEMRDDAFCTTTILQQKIENRAAEGRYCLWRMDKKAA